MTTQIFGIFCSKCRLRYVLNACKKAMPCDHQYAKAHPDGVEGPADFIYLHSWRYSGGFQRFEMVPIYFIWENDHFNVEYSSRGTPSFSENYIAEEEIEKKFLQFLGERIQLSSWPTWTEAFVSLVFGGTSLQLPPQWRVRQMIREREKANKMKEAKAR